MSTPAWRSRWATRVAGRCSAALWRPGSAPDGGWHAGWHGRVGREQEQHRLLIEHLTAEYGVKTEGRGRTVDEWKLRVDGLDNHWLDCLVGAAVAVSMQGALLFGTDTRAAPRQRIRLSELQGRGR